MVRAVPLTCTTRNGGALEAIWLPMPGGGSPVAVARALAREANTGWATLIAYCGAAGAESLTLRAVAPDGRIRVSRPIRCPADGWVSESLRLEAVPCAGAVVGPAERLEVIDTNHAPHHLVVACLSPSAVPPVGPEALMYPDEVVASLADDAEASSPGRLARARWLWIGGNVATAESEYTRLLSSATGPEAVRAEYERACLPVPARTPTDRCALLHACTIRCAGTAEARYGSIELAATLSALGRQDEAGRVLDAIIAAPRAPAIAVLAREQRARILASANDLPGALKAIAEAQAEAPTTADRCALRERARGWLHEAFTTTPARADWPPELAREYALWQAAQAPSLDLLPDAATGTLFGGLALLKHGESKRAARDLPGALGVHARLIRDFPYDPALVARARLYSIYAGGPTRPEAMDDLRRLIVDFPGHSVIVAAAYLNIGERSLRADHPDEAVRALHLVSLCRSGVLTFDLQAATRLAECYDRMGDADMSAATWRRVLAIAESRPDVSEFALAAGRARRALGMEPATGQPSSVTAGPG